MMSAARLTSALVTPSILKVRDAAVSTDSGLRSSCANVAMNWSFLRSAFLSEIILGRISNTSVNQDSNDAKELATDVPAQNCKFRPDLNPAGLKARDFP
jgi:hypothetical protein